MILRVGGTGILRLRALTAVVCVSVFVLGVAPGAVAGEGKKAKPKRAAATVSLVSGKQRIILRRHFVRVRVRTRRPASLRLNLVARRPSGKGRPYSVTRKRLVRLRRKGKRVFRLGLNAAGRRSFGACRTLTVRPAGRVRVRGAKRSRRLKPRARRLRPDTIRCGGGAGRFPPLGRLNTANAGRCDFLDPALCLYPFPNDHFTRADASTPTGRRLALNPQSVPKNRLGSPIDPTDQNRADGVSPGNLIATRVPGLDTPQAFRRTGAVPITDMARSFDRRQPVVVINARTRARQLIWSEIDSNPADREDVSLIIRPGRNFEEGERYIVALRRMRTAAGKLIPPQEEFRAYRDDLRTDNPAIERRRAHFERLFATLGRAGIGRRDLYLAWDFTVASRESLTGRALSIRDDAFAALGDTNLADLQVQGVSPQFVMNPDIDDSIVDGLGSIDTDPVPNPVDFGDVDGRRDYPPCSAGDPSACEAGESDRTARRITGQISVPCYLDAPGCPPGSKFSLGAGGKPQRTPGNTTLANVICTVPRPAVDGADPPRARPSLYGHGLLGSAGEVGGGSAQPFGASHNFVFCATDWIGMATTDVPNVVTLLQDLSNFASLVDRIQQGYVNFMYLGRWMIHPAGASSNPAFQVNGRSVIDTQRLFYDGNSQGGILSGGLTALSPDFQRAVHGVPGMNYSTLLRRSVDFDTYANGDFEGVNSGAGLYQSYPNELERPLLLSLIQLLWDRGESNGYAQHMTTDPLPGSPQHQVLLHPAFGDHQVANVSAEVEARTIGASAHRPVLFAGRSPDVTPLFGIPTAPLSGFTGSAIVYWDTGPLRTVDGQSRGTPAPPTTNVPPRAGNDPHGAPRADLKSHMQKSEFLRVGGTLSNPCGLGPCFAGGFAGP